MSSFVQCDGIVKKDRRKKKATSEDVADQARDHYQIDDKSVLVWRAGSLTKNMPDKSYSDF